MCIVYLSHQDFWNIAGRAGRTLVDTVGVVAFPAKDASRREEYIEFLSNEAQEVASQLATLIEQADDIAQQFDLQTLRAWPQLSALLQFLSHAMRVSGDENVADEVEDLLRASLVYHQTQGKDEQAARRLVSLCRAYLEQIRGQSGLLMLADKTGFATPSVLSLMGRTGSDRELTEASNWQPDRLFSEDIEPMRQRVQIIADLPEMQLGQSKGQPFNAERVAAILSDWVQGETLSSLAESYLISDETDTDKRVSQFSTYLFSELLGRASWGLGALESVSLRDASEEQWEEVGYIPSMIFFGVRRKESVWLRMVGVPRVVADGLGSLWQQTQEREPSTYEEIRSWINRLSDNDWKRALPDKVSLTPEDMRYIWQEFTG